MIYRVSKKNETGFLAATISSRSGSVRASMLVSVMLFSNMLYKSKGVQERLKGTKWGYLGSSAVKWGQTRPKGVKWGQERPKRVKCCLEGNIRDVWCVGGK